MRSEKFSVFTLERYRLGELDDADKGLVEEILAADGACRSSLENLDASDRELRARFPFKSLFREKPSQPHRPQRSISRHFRFASIAAVLLVCFLLPLIYFTRAGKVTSENGMAVVSDSLQDRAKGAVLSGSELSLYLKGAEETPLADMALLGEGDTVQLAYKIPAGEQYGVIFSIDGRSEVTMHYPYRKGQSSLMVPGRRTPLEEAYTLDDAPGYEVFVLVASSEPLDAEAVLSKAREITKTRNLSLNDIPFIEEASRSFFSDSEIAIITVLKE